MTMWTVDLQGKHGSHFCTLTLTVGGNDPDQACEVAVQLARLRAWQDEHGGISLHPPKVEDMTVRRCVRCE
mgnify:FL=1